MADPIAPITDGMLAIIERNSEGALQNGIGDMPSYSYVTVLSILSRLRQAEAQEKRYREALEAVRDMASESRPVYLHHHGQSTPVGVRQAVMDPGKIARAALKEPEHG